MTHFFSQTIWLTVVYTLIGVVLCSLWIPGIIRRTGPRPAAYISIVTTLIALVHSSFALMETWNQPTQEIVIPWLQVAGLDLSLPIQISSLNIGVCLVVTLLNLVAQIYGVGYMEMDWGWARFYAFLNLFEAGICGLALCDSLFFSYVILEILTLGTYLLVGFWFPQPLVVTGARDAFLTKRVGDLLLLMGVVALLPLTGTWDYNGLAQWANSDFAQAFVKAHPGWMNLIALAIIAGPIGKCAQFPLHLWLDEAMEGPIPASILRNSVVVATGAWILIKMEPILRLSSLGISVVILIGAATAVGASLIAIAQIDVKRILSYAASAYMGLIFIAVAMEQKSSALMLLLTHAIGTALLMMAIGAVIWHNISQNITQLGGLWSKRPITGISFLVGITALVGLPPFGAFWAMQDLISHLWDTERAIAIVVLLVNGFTAFSLIRAFGLIFKGEPKQMTHRSPEPIWLLTIPMMVVLGLALHLPQIWAMLSLIPSWENLDLTAAILLTSSSLIGIILGLVIYGNGRVTPVKLPWPAVQDFFAYDFYTAKLYRLTIVFVVGLVSTIIYWLDRYLVDGIVNLVGGITIFSGEGLKYNVSGQSQFYALTILVGISLLGLFLCWPFLL